MVGLLPSQSNDSWSALERLAGGRPMSAGLRIGQPAYRCLIRDGASGATYEALLCYLGSLGAHPARELPNAPGSRSAVFEECWRPAIFECLRSLAEVLGEELATDSYEEVLLP